MLFEFCQSTFSRLPELEPVLGAALALNLGYLGLARFRHRLKIRDHANKELAVFQPNGNKPPEKLTNYKHYKRVCIIAGLPNNDPEVNEKGKKTRLALGWGTVYIHLFHSHQDRYLSWACVGIASALLVLGVAHDTSIDQMSQCFFTLNHIGWWFFLGLAMIAYPSAAIYLGFNVVRSLTAFCTDEVEELNKLLANEIPAAAEQLDKNLTEAEPVVH